MSEKLIRNIERKIKRTNRKHPVLGKVALAAASLGLAGGAVGLANEYNEHTSSRGAHNAQEANREVSESLTLGRTESYHYMDETLEWAKKQGYEVNSGPKANEYIERLHSAPNLANCGVLLPGTNTFIPSGPNSYGNPNSKLYEKTIKGSTSITRVDPDGTKSEIPSDFLPMPFSFQCIDTVTDENGSGFIALTNTSGEKYYVPPGALEGGQFTLGEGTGSDFKTTIGVAGTEHTVGLPGDSDVVTEPVTESIDKLFRAAGNMGVGTNGATEVYWSVMEGIQLPSLETGLPKAEGQTVTTAMYFDSPGVESSLLTNSYVVQPTPSGA